MNNDPAVQDSPIGPALKPRIDTLFLSLVLVVAAINLPFFLNLVLPLHDTMNYFQNFYFFYNDLYFNGELAHWAPLGYYGVKSDFFFISMPPVLYLSGLFGYVFGITNTFALFKAGIFLEQIIFLYGVYRLSGIVFKRKATVLFVCLASVGGTVILLQSAFNFRIYYLLPLMIYLMMRFFSTYKPQYVLGAMIAGIITLLGGAPYYAAIILLEMAVICPVLFIGNLKALKSARMPGRRDILLAVLLLGLLVSLVVSYQYFVTHMVDETVILSGGRDPKTGTVGLKTFLTYGGDIDWQKFTDLWSPNYRLQLALQTWSAYDSSLYLGLIPLFFFLYGLFILKNFKNPLYVGVLLLAVVLAFFSVGNMTFFAAFLYEWFPLMKYFRHIGYVTACYKFLLPLLAGFGFEHLISRTDSGSGKRELLWNLVIAAFFLLSGLLISDTLKYVVPHNAVKWAKVAYMAFVISMVVVMFLLRLKMNPRHRTVIFVIALYLIEIISYQSVVHTIFAHMGQTMRPLHEEVFNVERLPYQPKRTMMVPHDRSRAASPLVFETTTYAHGYNFLQWDPCTPNVRANIMNENVYRLITLWGDGIDYMSVMLPNQPLLFDYLGCTTPKLRLTSDVLFAQNALDATHLVAKQPVNKIKVVLSDVAGEDIARWKMTPGRTEAHGTIEVAGYRANGIDLRVDVPEGPLWLYYADAWHSGWKALVNGKPARIARANTAFKAVLVPQGRSTVRLFFDAGASHTASVAIIIIGIIVMSFLLGAAIRTLLFTSAKTNNNSSPTADINQELS